MNRAMSFTNEDLEDVVDEITREQFATFCGWEGCNEIILDGIREKIKENILKREEKGKMKCRPELIFEERPKVVAIYHSVKVLYDARAALEQKEGNTGDTKEEIEEKKTTTTSPQSKYLNYLCEYKKDEDLVSRVKGLEMRGKNYKVSKDGSCPSCRYKSNVFVILDFLFPAGDMPEIMTYLLGLGKAILWSSKQNMKCKDPPTFLCNGKCPFSDVMRCGFNLNWTTTDLEKIFLFPEKNYVAVKKPQNKPQLQSKKGKQDQTLNIKDRERQDEFDDLEYEVYDESKVDIEHYRGIVSWFVIDEHIVDKNEIPAEERSMVRTMLALEQAREDFVNGKMKCIRLSSDEEESSDEERSSGEESSNTNDDESQRNDGGTDTSAPTEKVSAPESTTSVSPVITIRDNEEKKNSAVKESSSMDIEIYDLDDDGHAKTVDEDVVDLTVEAVTTTATNVLSPTLDSVFVNAQTLVNSVCITTPGFTGAVTTVSENSTPTHILKGASYYDPQKQSSTKTKPAFTADDFPVSKNGACPYCLSEDVVYIILKESDTSDEQLPDLLEKLRSQGKAEVRVKGEYDMPSFQCRGCTYGFNLDWASTNLENVFSTPKKSEITTASTMYSAATATSATSYNANTTSTTAAAYTDYSAYYAQQGAYPNPYMTPMPFMPGAMMPMMPMMPMPMTWQGFPPMIPGMVTPAGMIPPPAGVVPPVAGISQMTPQVMAMPPYYQNPYQWNQAGNMWGYPPPPPAGVVAVTTSTITEQQNATLTTTAQVSGVAEVSDFTITSAAKAIAAESTPATEIIDIDMDTEDSDACTETEENVTFNQPVIDLTVEEGTTLKNVEENEVPKSAEKIADAVVSQLGEIDETIPVSVAPTLNIEQSGSSDSHVETDLNKALQIDEPTTLNNTQETNASKESIIADGISPSSSANVSDAPTTTSANAVGNTSITSTNTIEKCSVTSSTTIVAVTTSIGAQSSAISAIQVAVDEHVDKDASSDESRSEDTSQTTSLNNVDHQPIVEVAADNTENQQRVGEGVEVSEKTGGESDIIDESLKTLKTPKRGRVKNKNVSTPARTTRSTRKRAAQLTTDDVETAPVPSKHPCVETNDDRNQEQESVAMKGGGESSVIETETNSRQTNDMVVETKTNVAEILPVTSEATEMKSENRQETLNCDTSLEEMLATDDTTGLLTEPSSPTTDKLFSIEENVNVNMSKLRNELLNNEESMLDVTSPFTDSLVNIVADSSEIKEGIKPEKTNFLFNDLIPDGQEEHSKSEDATVGTPNDAKLTPLNTEFTKQEKQTFVSMI